MNLPGKLLGMMVILPLILFSCEKNTEKTAVVDLRNKINNKKAEDSANKQPLRIAIAAIISPKATALYYEEMMKFVGKKAGRPVEILQRKTYKEVNDMLEKKELDLAFICSGPYVAGHKKFDMELLVAPMMYGKSSYQAYFIVHKSSGISSIEGLRNKRFAFTDPDSNTGKLVPTYLLSKMGETPESFFKDFIFTYSHDNSIKAVSKELADGASVDSLIWDYYNDTDPEFTRNTKIIYKSPPYGIPPVVVHPDTPAPLKETLRRIFLNMHEDPEGRLILSELRIEKFIMPADSSYNTVREMQEWVDKHK